MNQRGRRRWPLTLPSPGTLPKGEDIAGATAMKRNVAR
jgi:hypothetical protein